MTILLLANHFNAGGITTYLLTLSRGFVDQGHRVIVVSSGGEMVEVLEGAGVRHIHFALNLKCEVHPRIIVLALRLAKLVCDEKVDVIHAQTRTTQMCAAIASRMTGVPTVSTCHGFFRPHIGRKLLPLWGKRVIAISTVVKKHLVDDFHLAPQRIALIPNGIDTARFLPLSLSARSGLRGQWGLGEEPVLGIVARLSDVKGHQFLVGAMSTVLEKFPGTKCLIFGSGPMERSLKAQVLEAGLEKHVLFYPVVNRTAEVLPLLDLFVMPSLQEGLGLSVLEAAAMGIPSVVSRVGGLPEVVMDGETGLLVSPQDPCALAGAICALLSDPSRLRVMGMKAREFVLSQYSAGPMTEQTLALYQSVAGQR